MIKTGDVKILWGRSGNQCAFPDCRIELTVDGAKSTLGEMAHIIAEKTKGARGKSSLTDEQRDEYSNLILLCPTHHTLIDKNPEEWTVEKLKQMKNEHENWVSNQLNQNNISINSIDNSEFIQSRKKDWISFAKNDVWVIVSLTPLNTTLNVFEDYIDPLETELLKSINNLFLPQFNGYEFISHNLNLYNTKPNENGVINEESENIKQCRFGHRIQFFRNGYCEFMICLKELKKHTPPHGLLYKDIAISLIAQIKGLINIWNNHLSFNDMSLTTLITKTNGMRLYSGEKLYNGIDISGDPVRLPELEYSIVINKSDDVESIKEKVIKRFVNYFGLNVDSIFNENGNLNPPRTLMNNIYYDS